MKERAKKNFTIFENPYDFGYKANLISFFGSPGYLYSNWWFPNFNFPPGDGMKFKEKTKNQRNYNLI